MSIPSHPAVASPPSMADLQSIARRIRCDIVEMTTRAGSGHPSSSLSEVEVLVGLYYGGILRHDPARPDWPDRDRFVLSKGHGVPALYAVLADRGYFPREWLTCLRMIDCPLEGHPNMRRVPGLEASTGSLGQGLSIGLGIALAARLDGRDYHTWVMLGDGECDEGQVWEAAMAAHHYRVDQLTVIVDRNGFQQTGATADVMNLDPLPAKWQAFGWQVREINGHDIDEVRSALEWARQEGTSRTLSGSGPSVIISHTHKGYPVSFVMADFSYHGKALTEEEARRAREELGCS
ncbi:MAG: transketolase [Armatimonadetes bacterium]|nr:transketolase [Armatimonadota bacterium]